MSVYCRLNDGGLRCPFALIILGILTPFKIGFSSSLSPMVLFLLGISSRKGVGRDLRFALCVRQMTNLFIIFFLHALSIVMFGIVWLLS